jgi:hypothetical protein
MRRTSGSCTSVSQHDAHAALTVTEQQFLRLVGSANPIVHLWMHPVTVPGPPRIGS